MASNDSFVRKACRDGGNIVAVNIDEKDSKEGIKTVQNEPK